MPLTANEIWRDFETTGTPASGAHKPVKSEIRAWGTALEALGGFNVPGADTTAALFSQGAGVAPVFRKIVGFDLPNPSTTTPGAVFAKPTVAGQVLTGLGADGEFETGTLTANNPNFTGTISLDGLPFIDNVGGQHVMYGPEGRMGIVLAPGAASLYRGTTHTFQDALGTDVFGVFDEKGLALSPKAVAGSDSGLPAINFAYLWNTTGFCSAVRWVITNQNSSPTSRALQIFSGPAGGNELFSIFADHNNATITMNGRAVFASPSGNANFIYSTTVGISYINASGGAFTTLVSNAGVWSFMGTTSGSHAVSAAAVASGASTFPNTNGELLNTGKGVTFKVMQTGVNMNAANNDNPITFSLPPGCTRFRISSATIINNGPTASLTTCSYGLFSAAAGGGTAWTASANLTAITSATPGTAGTFTNLATGTLAATMFNTPTATVYFRSLIAQGAPVTVDIAWNVEGYP